MTHHSADVSPQRGWGGVGGDGGRDPGREEDAEGTWGCQRAGPSPVCSGVKTSSGDKPLRWTNFLKASRASGFMSGFLPAGQAPGESGLRGYPEAGSVPAPREGAGQKGSVWGGCRAGAEEMGPSQPTGPGKEVGKPQGTPKSLGAPGGPRPDSRATCRVRPLTWKGFSPRGTALPLTREPWPSPPVRVPAPGIPPSALPTSPTLTKPWPETPGSGTLHVQ